MTTEEILKKLGLKYDELTTQERETLSSWMTALEQSKLNIDGIKAYIASMRDAVEQELTETKHNTNHDLFLKARLRNYMLLEAFLSTPEKAKQAMEKAMAGIVKK